MTTFSQNYGELSVNNATAGFSETTLKINGTNVPPSVDYKMSNWKTTVSAADNNWASVTWGIVTATG